MRTAQFAFLPVAFVLCGRSMHPGYRPDASHPIRTITISRDVHMPRQMEFVGLSETLAVTAGASVAGAAGAATVASGNSTRSGSNDFGLPEAVRSEFAEAIRQSGQFVLRNEGPADAELRLAVEDYGFHEAEIFARRVNPVLVVRAKLVRPDGTVAWKFVNVVTHLTGGTPAILPEKIRANPKIGANALRVAARLCAEKAVATLQK